MKANNPSDHKSGMTKVSEDEMNRTMFNMMSCAASAAEEDLELAEQKMKMRNTLLNHFIKNLFCSEESNRAWLNALRKTVKKFAETDNSKDGSRTCKSLNAIYDKRQRKLIDWYCKGYMTLGQVRRWLKELRALFKELNIELI